MSTLKCKMCGGELNVTEGASVVECEYCGSVQTVPKMDDEKKLTLFGRANRLRLNCEFDKAAGIYENIVAEFPEEAEAYWGLVLCTYGIEYVDDPATAKKVPTCHRSSFDSVMDDDNFEQACENADPIARRQYREEAKQLEELRKGILEVSGKEEPYDIFICYKETDENGERTIDSVIAQDIYDALTEKGYRVFFSRISLEDKLGTEYEPYIFAALNSARLMLAVGTDYEYYNAVWVKNEWSRYLKLMAKNREKHLIPCYKNLDAYDMPKEFARLQAQDMGKVGAMQDLLRGIEKILGGKEEKTVKETVVIHEHSGPDTEAMLGRGRLFLEDGDWKSAKEYFDKALDLDPECAGAYLGMMMAKNSCRTEDRLPLALPKLKSDPDFRKAVRFAGPEMKTRLQKIADSEDNVLPLWQKICRRSARAGAFLSVGKNHTVGLRSDGTVVMSNTGTGQGDVENWTGVIAVSEGNFYTAGLRSDGSVLLAGENVKLQKIVTNWTGIVAFAGRYNIIGLRADGAVVTTPSIYSYKRKEKPGWEDLVALSSSDDHTVGLTADGTVVAEGCDGDGQCDVSGWKLFGSIDTLEEELAAADAERRVRWEKEAAERKVREEKEAAERKAREEKEAAERKAREE